MCNLHYVNCVTQQRIAESSVSRGTKSYCGTFQSNAVVSGKKQGTVILMFCISSIITNTLIMFAPTVLSHTLVSP